MSDCQVCTTYDGFMGDNTLWVATLNDGTQVYQDDHRAGCTEHSAWMRLINYCKDTGKYVTGFRIEFRDHVERLPDNADGYFFSLGSIGILASESVTFNLFVTGYIDNDVVRIQKWKVPEVIVMEQTTREIEKCEHLMVRKPC